MDITQSELKSLLSYDPDTGIFRWLVSNNRRIVIGAEAGSLHKHGYILIKIHNTSYRAHRLVWLYIYGEFPPEHIDHINGMRADNRLFNLRPATNTENLNNRGKQNNNTSGHKGVYWNKRDKKWQANCRVDGKLHFLGYFATPELASDAYQTFAKLHHGEFYRDDNTLPQNKYPTKPQEKTI